MGNEVMKNGEYLVLLLIFLVGILWIPDNLGVAAMIISIGLIYCITPIFDYKKYMNPFFYWILVFVILFTIFIPSTLLVPTITENPLLKYGSIIVPFILCIWLAYIKMQKLEKKFNSTEIG